MLQLPPIAGKMRLMLLCSGTKMLQLSDSTYDLMSVSMASFLNQEASQI
jgi:hypothetical protein